MELKDLNYYFDLSNFIHRDLFAGSEYVWDFLTRLSDYVIQNLQPAIAGTVMPGAFVGDNVHIGKGTVVQPGAWIHGPAIIGDNCEIRHGAYVGANTITGDGVVIGHASEVGNSVFLNDSRAPHFAFVGHSVLGNKVNLGAGTKISNYKVTATNIKVGGVDTGLLKVGVLIGDNSSLGCNSVLQPGSLLGRHVYSYPLALIRGFVPSSTIIKVRPVQEDARFEHK